MKMIRTQVQLPKDFHDRVRRLAHERGVSTASLIRQGVEKLLQEESAEARWDRVLSVVGIARSEVADLSTNHDQYVAEAHSG